jgi:hypothetical protein
VSKLVFSLILCNAALRASAFEYSAFVEFHNAGSKCQQSIKNEISASQHFLFGSMITLNDVTMTSHFTFTFLLRARGLNRAVIG